MGALVSTQHYGQTRGHWSVLSTMDRHGGTGQYSALWTDTGALVSTQHYGQTHGGTGQYSALWTDTGALVSTQHYGETFTTRAVPRLGLYIMLYGTLGFSDAYNILLTDPAKVVKCVPESNLITERQRKRMVMQH